MKNSQLLTILVISSAAVIMLIYTTYTKDEYFSMAWQIVPEYISSSNLQNSRHDKKYFYKNLPRKRDNFLEKAGKVKGKFTEEELLTLLRNPVNMTLKTIDLPEEYPEHIILLWWPPGYAKDGLEKKYRGMCGKCRLTTDRNQLNKSKVLIFDNVPSNNMLKQLPLASTRSPQQAYVLWVREAPSRVYHLRESMKSSAFDNMFNYTISFRRDADIVVYFGNKYNALRNIKLQYGDEPQKYFDNIMKQKHFFAVWVVSNCARTKGAIGRMNYAEQLLAEGLKVDLYGECFNKSLPKRDFTSFLLSYKFYLSFENSWHCKDYLTEKFWRNGLMANVVPVIWGPSPEDVAAVAPPHSYIHSEDFASPGELVKYLNHLDENDDLYMEYFNWKFQNIPNNTIPTGMIGSGLTTGACKLCRVLFENNGILPHKIAPSITDWVFIDEKSGNSCFSSGLNNTVN